MLGRCPIPPGTEGVVDEEFRRGFFDADSCTPRRPRTGARPSPVSMAGVVGDQAVEDIQREPRDEHAHQDQQYLVEDDHDLLLGRAGGR